MTAPSMLAPAHLNSLADIAQALVADDKGLLAIDESVSTCNKRFGRLGITQDEETRRAYRELIITTPALGECISGVILFDETIRQHTTDGSPFLTVLADAGIIAGIKVDLGAKPMAGHPGEKVTEGLDGLRERGSRSGGPSSRSVTPSRADPVWTRTPTPWRATPRCVRRPAWCPSSNRKY
jgi:fructose-bisphosphate aldolase class I